MHSYTEADTLRVAKRYRNPKRSYLLVDPLQAKHIPVSPTASLDMMAALGAQVAAAHPEARLVIGFAETATAIGAAVAAGLGPDCVYLHTTREPLAGDWILFQEEHSHAVEQRLCADRLAAWIAATPTVVFVDDELSTGRTLRNMVRQLRERFPLLAERQLAAASILSRVSPEDQARLAADGVACQCLVRLADRDYDQLVAPLSVEEAVPPPPGPLPALDTLRKGGPAGPPPGRRHRGVSGRLPGSGGGAGPRPPAGAARRGLPAGAGDGGVHVPGPGGRRGGGGLRPLVRRPVPRHHPQPHRHLPCGGLPHPERGPAAQLLRGRPPDISLRPGGL